jgi:hypothetical protein
VPTGVDVTNEYYFRRKNIGVFLKTNVTINFLHNLALFWVKHANFFTFFTDENILKIIKSIPGVRDWEHDGAAGGGRRRVRALPAEVSQRKDHPLPGACPPKNDFTYQFYTHL